MGHFPAVVGDDEWQIRLHAAHAFDKLRQLTAAVERFDHGRDLLLRQRLVGCGKGVEATLPGQLQRYQRLEEEASESSCRAVD
jgi:hypothetical protein